MSACFLATLYLDDERARIQSEIQSLRTSLGPQLSSGTTSHDPVQRMSDVKKNHWPMVELLAQLAATLPDDTFLDAVDINSSDIRIEGQSQNVAELPRILGQNAAFSEIAFKSPTIKREGVRGDLFELGIKIADRGERRP